MKPVAPQHFPKKHFYHIEPSKILKITRFQGFLITFSADFQCFFGVPLKSAYGFELTISKLLGFVTETDGIYRMTLKGVFYYTLAYIDKMWENMRKEAFPARIEL